MHTPILIKYGHIFVVIAQYLIAVLATVCLSLAFSAQSPHSLILAKQTKLSAGAARELRHCSTPGVLMSHPQGASCEVDGTVTLTDMQTCAHRSKRVMYVVLKGHLLRPKVCLLIFF